MEKQILVLGFILFVCLTNGCKKDDNNTGPVSDTEGNNYSTVKIGNQVWMAENLRATRLNDGTAIPLTSDADTWRNLTSPSYCWYNNDEASFKDTYGALYNGYTISTGKICPTGWHVPAKEEWLTLTGVLGDSLTAGGKLKESGTEHWFSPNKGADNSSGFTALPSGIRYFEGTFASKTYISCFWISTDISADEEWYAGVSYADAAATLNHRNKRHGFSVRCLKD
jgi:uncharacterized protein (TIGR02145 family)